MQEALTLGAAELARRIRARELSPVEVVEAHIARIERVNPRINALITPRFTEARAEARAAAERLETGETDTLPPLFGVPVTIKDCWAVAGARFTGGSVYHRDDVADTDAEAVRLLREAGAIVLGKTNLPDMCWSGESINPVFGRTNNPRDLTRSAGGSSGGEGAIIAAGGSPLGLGSDIAGSVRIPAAMNGCVSLKPTGERIPADDHVPPAPPELRGWNVAGPMARRIEDLALALRVLSRTPTRDYTTIDLNGRRCTVYIHNGLYPVRAPVVEAVSMAAGTLKRAGMDARRDDSLPLLQVELVYAALFRRYGTKGFKWALGGGERYSLPEEIRAHLRGAGRISPNVLFFAEEVDLMGRITSLLGMESFKKLERLRERMLDTMAGGVILCPLLVTPPPRHGWIYTVGLQIPYTTMFNALGFPAVVLPVAYTTRGLPLAVQVVAPPGEDELALAVAAELERVYGGWRMADNL
jgi:Asp-tRNA(Asn)/Glu-tRNA(Gln) amidotransferase A subunit family amidase